MALKRTRLIRKTSRDGRCQGISNLISFILGVGETDRRANVAVMSVLNADVHGTNLAIVLPSSVIEDLIDQMHYRPGTAQKDAKQARDRPVNYYYKPCMNTEFSCSWRCVICETFSIPGLVYVLYSTRFILCLEVQSLRSIC